MSTTLLSQEIERVRKAILTEPDRLTPMWMVRTMATRQALQRAYIAESEGDEVAIAASLRELAAIGPV